MAAKHLIALRVAMYHVDRMGDEEVMDRFQKLDERENVMDSKNVSVSQSWLRTASRIIAANESIVEAARAGAKVPEWLKDYFEKTENLLAELETH